MQDFFRGWRRKTGGVMLLLACVLLAGWMRRLSATDGILVNGGPVGLIVLGSGDSSIVLVIRKFDAAVSTLQLASDPYESLDSEAIPFIWHCKYAGFRHGIGKNDDGVRVWVVPYWPVVLGFTLLAGRLLLSKPVRRSEIQ